jgi:hypothetical protein
MKNLYFALAFFLPLSIFAQNVLTIAAENVYIEARENGYHLFVKKEPQIGSILLTESFEREDHKIPTYSLRALGFNEVNGNERRILDGEFIDKPLYSLIDSTPENNPRLGGEAFHILIPPVVEYGYPYTARRGRYSLRNMGPDDEPFWFSIRAFEKPYGDYTGAYRDNAFEILISEVQAPEPKPEEQDEPLGAEYLPGLEEKYDRFSERTIQSDGGDDLIDKIEGLIRGIEGDTLDVILALDTTKSMESDLEALRAKLLDPVKAATRDRKSFRIGLMLYRDYMEEYLTRTIPFQTTFELIQDSLNKAKAFGGGDKPEAVLEALYGGLTGYAWESEARMLILIGDAPQHDVPRGRITEDMVTSLASELGVEIVSIMLPF